MNLKIINDNDLHIKTKLAAKKEKAATLELLEHLAEVSRRNLYVEYGYSTLHKYIVKELGYSGAEAWTRVNAMKLVRDDMHGCINADMSRSDCRPTAERKNHSPKES